MGTYNRILCKSLCMWFAQLPELNRKFSQGSTNEILYHCKYFIMNLFRVWLNSKEIDMYWTDFHNSEHSQVPPLSYQLGKLLKFSDHCVDIDRFLCPSSLLHNFIITQFWFIGSKSLLYYTAFRLKDKKRTKGPISRLHSWLFIFFKFSHAWQSSQFDLAHVNKIIHGNYKHPGCFMYGLPHEQVGPDIKGSRWAVFLLSVSWNWHPHTVSGQRVLILFISHSRGDRYRQCLCLEQSKIRHTSSGRVF